MSREAMAQQVPGFRQRWFGRMHRIDKFFHHVPPPPGAALQTPHSAPNSPLIPCPESQGASRGPWLHKASVRRIPRCFLTSMSPAQCVCRQIPRGLLKGLAKLPKGLPGRCADTGDGPRHLK